MFGHRDDNKDEHQEDQAAVQHDQPADQVVHPGDDQAPADAPAPDQPADEEPAAVAAESASDAIGEPAAAGPEDTDTFEAGEPSDSTLSEAPAEEKSDWQHPGEPIDDGPEPINDVIYPAGLPKPPTIQPGGSPSDPAPLADESSPDDQPANPQVHQLLDIKVKALDELAPLIDDLDMPAEEKFRTVMMMIQASDNQELVPKAYEIAHTIEDEKTRAQALLDIVNEINYFTQPHHEEAA